MFVGAQVSLYPMTDGFVDVTGIDVSFNDSTQFVRLPAETEFVTFVATDPGATPAPK